MKDYSIYAEGYQKYRKAMIELSKPIYDKRINENMDEWISITKNILFNTKGQRIISKTLTKEEEIISKVKSGFLEIALSYDSITEIPLYLKKYPQNLTWKSKFLEFIIVNYFNEVYILSERLEVYSNNIKELYKKHPNIAKLEEPLLTLNKLLNKFFKKSNNKTRGLHVHTKRYQDDELSRLVYLELLYQNANGSKDKLVASEYKKALAFNKRKWQDFFEKRNKSYEEILDIYFTIIHSIVFDKNGNFRNPNK